VRVKTDARREAILSAAKEVFEELGFEQATMSEITARLGSSKATLYRYFDSKEALFLELVRRSASEHGGESRSIALKHGREVPGQAFPPKVLEAADILDPTEDVASVLKRVGKFILKTFHTPQKLATHRMVIAASINPEVGKLFYENGPKKGMKFLEHYFESVMDNGKLRKADAHVVACHFRGLLDSEVHEAGLFNVVTELSDKRIAGIVDRAVDVFIRAYGVPFAP
jgi:AcrR family transcriptional regulator